MPRIDWKYVPELLVWASATLSDAQEFEAACGSQLVLFWIGALLKQLQGELISIEWNKDSQFLLGNIQ